MKNTCIVNYYNCIYHPNITVKALVRVITFLTFVPLPCLCAGYVQGMNIIMESEVSLTEALRNDSFEEVLIGEGIIQLNSDRMHMFLKPPYLLS